MTAPTREQVIQWAKDAGFEIGCINSIDGDEVFNPRTHDKHGFTDELVTLVRIAHAAARAQALDEAAGVCESKANGYDLSGENTDDATMHLRATAARSCASAIQALKGKQ